MKKVLLLAGLLFFVSTTCPAQESGNRIYGYSQNKRQPTLNSGNLMSNNTFLIDASVLANVKPDSFVAVFGVQEEASKAAESIGEVNERVNSFEKRLASLGIAKSDIYVDFITQNRVYDFEVAGETASEFLSGFETKKTVAVKYADRSQFEEIVNAATNSGIFDLIKVDYIVSDFEAVRERLFAEAVGLVKKKEERYGSALGMTIKSVGLSVEKYDAFYPGERYEGYKAFEAGAARSTNNRNTRTIISLRKSSTFYYEPLGGSKFDRVLSPNGIEPVVQFTIYIQVRYNLI